MTKRKLRTILKVLLIAFSVILVLGALFLFSWFTKVTDVAVEGCMAGNEQRVAELILPGEDDYRLFNVLIRKLSGAYRHPAFTEVEFELTGLHTLSISVSEAESVLKMQTDTGTFYYSLLGYRVGGDASAEELPVFYGIPFSSGAFYDQPEMTEENRKLFTDACETAAECARLKLPVLSISCEDAGYVIHFGEVSVILGSFQHMAQKLFEVSCQYDKYKGLSGVLHLENFDPEEKDAVYTFTVR